MRVLSVVGARPNFMKLAPVDRELVKRGVEHVIVHTGQHYDHGMSTAFFEQLWIPTPDFHLGVGSGSHAQQTAAVMQRLESIVVELTPDLVLLYGSTNSTLAAALALDAATRYGVQGAPYAVVTLHQPGNVDDRAVLRELLDAIERLGRTLAVVFPVHPRTRQRIRTHGLRLPDGGRMRLLEPLGYLEMLGLVAGAALVVTDSGGLQDETSFLGVPCLTVRSSTERPITCTHGTNRLVLPKRDAVLAAAERALARRSPARPVIERWDGRAAERIARVVCEGERFELDAPLAAALPHAPRRAVAIPQPLGAG